MQVLYDIMIDLENVVRCPGKLTSWSKDTQPVKSSLTLLGVKYAFIDVRL